MRFKWDAAKNEANKKKHGIGFEEAKELFLSGVDYLEIYDETHSETEDRFIAIGPIRRGTVLVVWTEWTDDVVRIVSARFTTRAETRLYLQYMKERR